MPATLEERQQAREVLKRLLNKHVVGRELFPSSSDPDKTYEVLTYGDGTKSCNCPAWTRRNPPTGRTCRHVES